ncbi:MAG: universal stress protein [Ferruginibacter sp.]
MKTILAPTNFSALSLNAVNYAADLARIIGARLCLMHIFPMTMAFSEVPAPGNSMMQMEEEAGEEMQLLKEKIFNRTGGKVAIDTEIRTGYVVTEVENYCEQVQPYAVVVGAESAGSLERFFLGGRTTGTIREISCPVIVVPPDATFHSIEKIGLACDFRNVVETIPAGEIRELVHAFKAELHIIHVSESTGALFNPDIIAETGWLQEMLGELKPKYHFLKFSGTADTEHQICDFAEHNSIDLLIVIPKKHNLIGRLFKHSCSKQLVLQAHIPVMAVHDN